MGLGVFSTEEDLIESFISTTDASVWTRAHRGGGVKSVFESDCSDGRADWVWARMAGKWPSSWCDETLRVVQNPTCSRILSYLKRSSPRTQAFLRSRLSVSNPTFEKAIRDLVNVKLVRRRSDDIFLLASKADIPSVEICAFEFKLDDWKRALFQATRYRSFAHRVYVVLPTSIITRTEKLWDSFQMQNIGLLAHDRHEGSERVLLSRKSEPRSRSNYYQALGMIQQWA